MPRKPRSTASGAPGQPAVTPVGVPYGEGERALESQRRMPVPDFAAQGAAGGPSPGSGATPQQGGPDYNAVLEMAQQMAPPEPILSQPTERPMEEVTAPLRNIGQGAQRVVPNEAVYELRALAQRFPYPGLLKLLRQIDQEGRHGIVGR